MRKVLGILIFGLFSLLFINCGGGDSEDSFEFKAPKDVPVSPPVEKCKYCIPEGALFTCREIEAAMDFLNNTVRAEVGVSPLEWDCQLAEAAQRWADYLAEHGLFEHEKDSPYGENLYAFGGGPTTLLDAIKSWYEEKKFFDPNLPQWCDGGNCLHYTQLIWKDTQKIGCGMAKYKIKYKDVFDYVVVCKFYPRGNIIGDNPLPF